MAESKVMRDLKERMAAVETRCPLREQIVNEQFKAVAEDLTDIKVGMSKIFDVLNNGLKQTIADHAKQIEYNKSNPPLPAPTSDRYILGMSPEVRSKVIGWGIRVAIFLLAGERGYSIFLK